MSDNDIYDELRAKLEALAEQSRRQFWASIAAMAPGQAAYILGLTDEQPLMGFKSWEDFDKYIHAGDDDTEADDDHGR